MSKPLLKPTPATAIDGELVALLRAEMTVAQRACWQNSVLAMLRFPSEIPLCYYVEGWLVDPDAERAIEHGWLEVEGHVVDVTLTEEVAESYYGVFRYSVDECVRRCSRRGSMPFFARSKKGRQAMRAAFAALPIHHQLAVVWAHLGEHYTGIRSVVLDWD